MSPARWGKIEEIYHAALARDAAARTAYLDSACGSDAGLRAEVESLLESEPRAKNFLETRSPEVTQTSMLGRKLGPYRVVSQLGAGGMGEVYRAHDTKLGRDVAIKTLPREFADHAERLARFRREARTLASLNHPNIAAIYGLEESEGTTCLVLELVEGETLQGPLPLYRLLDYACQLAEALEAAHAKGIIHRDLKPANIKVTPQGRVKVLDFGLAKALWEADENRILSQSPTVTVVQTGDGLVGGTPPYMSPEQARGEALDVRSDLWSLGVVLYELVAGARPFEGGSGRSVLAAILTEDPVPLRARNPKTPAELERVVSKLLKKDRERRYRDAAGLLADLRSLAARKSWRSQRKYWIAGAAATVVLAGGGLLWQRLRAKPLTDKDVLVLADFTNTTGESIFDGTLREALAIQIDESPFLRTLSDERVRIDLGLMGLPVTQRITNDVARNMCQRENQRATIGGSIARLGKSYVIGIESTECRTGDPLARVQAEAPDQEHVLEAVQQAAKGMRRKLGESLSAMQKLKPTGETDRVTTTSLQAFQSFAQGASLMRQGSLLQALPLFKRATELDPNFATAWDYLGVVHLSLTVESAGDFARAFALRDRATEAEKFLIDGHYYASRNEWEKAIESDDLWIRAYPRNHIAHISAGYAHSILGELDDALREQLESYRLEPRNPLGNGSLIWVYKDLNRFDEAKRIGETELAQNPDDFLVHGLLLQIALLQRDDAGAAKQIEWFHGKPTDGMRLQYQIEAAKVRGRFRDADEMLRQLNELRGRMGFSALPGRSAQEEALLANCSPAKKTDAPTAVALALCGDSAQTERSLKRTTEELAKQPDNTILKAIGLPSMRAAAALKLDRPAEAIELLQPSMHYERRYPEVVYLRGLSYLQARKGMEAAEEFQKIIDRKGACWGPFYPVSYIALGRAATMAGDTARARKAYQDFLALWKDADPGTAILIDASKEYAALR